MTDEEIKGILFPMELAEISDEIVPWVDLMRRKLGGKVHILHVIPKIDYLHVHYALDPSRFDDVDTIAERTKEKIKKFSPSVLPCVLCGGNLPLSRLPANCTGKPLHRVHPLHPANRRKPSFILGIQQVFHPVEHLGHEFF